MGGWGGGSCWAIQYMSSEYRDIEGGSLLKQMVDGSSICTVLSARN